MNKSFPKHYVSLILGFAIAGAIPWVISLFKILTTTTAEIENAISSGSDVFPLWLLIALPCSFIIGIVATSFAGSFLKLEKGNQSLKRWAQIAIVIGCLDILTPIIIFTFFLAPIFFSFST